MMSGAKRRWSAGFFWIGAASTVGAICVVLAGNTAPVWRLEHQVLPLSWALAGVAVLAFLAVEFCHSVASRPSETQDRSPQLSSEPDSAETQISVLTAAQTCSDTEASVAEPSIR